MPEWASTILSSGALVSLMASAVAWVMSTYRAACDRRRGQYADAADLLAAWAEYPYRIRRRTSDGAATLTQLADIGHALQERTASVQSLLTSDRPVIAERFTEALTRAKLGDGISVNEAWLAPPATTPAAMNLGLPPDAGSAERSRRQFMLAATFGVGWRRFVPAYRVRQHVRAAAG